MKLRFNAYNIDEGGVRARQIIAPFAEAQA